MEELLEYARSLRASGIDLEGVLAELRARGASIVDSLKIVRDVEEVSLGRAKEIVDASPTWADQRASNQQIRKDLSESWAELDE